MPRLAGRTANVGIRLPQFDRSEARCQQFAEGDAYLTRTENRGFWSVSHVTDRNKPAPPHRCRSLICANYRTGQIRVIAGMSAANI
jgi:hypothetical protein